MFRNRIINGNFDIWQRGTSFTNQATSTYTTDRFFNAWDGAGATRTISRQSFTQGQTDVPGNPLYFYRFAQTVAGSGGSYNNCLIQLIEGVQTFAGQPIVVSFWARATVGTVTLSSTMRQNFGISGSGYVDFNPGSQQTFVLTSNWQRYTFQYFVPSITGKTIGSSGDFLALFNYVNTNLVQTIDFASVQVEAGTVATPFEVRPYGVELQLCQRYYHRTCNSGSNAIGYPLSPFTVITATNAQGIYKLPVTMRSNVISCNFTAGSGVYLSWDNDNLSVTGVSLSGPRTSPDAVTLFATVSGATTGQVRYLIVYNGYIDFSAEL
jgi:hypothetical protein